MKLLCTLSKIEYLDKMPGLVDGIICGSYFCDRQHYRLDEMRLIRQKTRESNLKMFALIDTMVMEEDITLLYEYMDFLKELEVDGIYFNDLAVYQVAAELKVLHLLRYDSSTLTTNSLDSAFFIKSGVSAVTLAREITFEEMMTIAENVGGKVDAVIFGYQKMASSKRHFLSNYFKYIDKQQDVLDMQNIRIVETTRSYAMPILENKYGTKIYTDYIFYMYQESLELANYLEYGIIDDIFLNEDCLFHVLRDYKKMNSKNALELENRLKARFIKLPFSKAYLYQKTNTTKKD